MRIRLMSRWTAALVGLVAVGVTGCKGEEAQPEAAKEQAPPKFEPAADKEWSLEGVGVTITAPSNLKLTEAQGKATLEAPGFPTVTVRAQPSDGSGLGRMASAGTKRVRLRIFAPETEWVCEAQSPGEHKERLVAICGSMTPPKKPRWVKTKCEVEGLDEGSATAAFEKHLPEVQKCWGKLLEDPEFVGRSYSMSRIVSGGSTSVSRAISGKDDATKECVKAATDAIGAEPALAGEGDTRASCKSTFTLF